MRCNEYLYTFVLDMIRRPYLAILIAVFMPLSADAQVIEDNSQITNVEILAADSATDIGSGRIDCSVPMHRIQLEPYDRTSYSAMPKAERDTVNLPLLTPQGAVPLMSSPDYGWWGGGMWNLHSGLNINVGASVFAAFGKGSPKGAGFSQDLSLMYAMPLTKRLSLAVGGWVSNAYWAHDRFTDAGVSAVLGYKFDEHWETYVYGRKSVLNKPVPYKFYTMDQLGDRIGAAVKYNFNPHFSVQVSVSMGRNEWGHDDGDVWGPDGSFR